MKYLTFSDPERTQYSIAILSPRLNKGEMTRWYLDPYLSQYRDEIIAYTLYKEPKKTSVKIQKEYLETLLPTLIDLKIKYLIVTDGEYFKTLTKSRTVDSSQGYVLDCVVGDFKVIYCPNYSQIFYDPEKVKARIHQSLTALLDHINGSYEDPGDSIIKLAAYPTTDKEIHTWLQRLIDMDCDLTADIETFSLKHYDSGIGTIAFSWNKGEGIAFPVDLRPLYGPGLPGQVTERYRNPVVRELLRQFFIRFNCKIIWHNITFDVYILIYQLFMEDLVDTENLLFGLETMLKHWDDTKLITYLATNSCAENKLGLKSQAQEYAGNFAQENIKDIAKIPFDDLLQYNLVDCLSTWYVYEKHYDTMIQDDQQTIYEGLFKDAVVDIIQMQLTGLPVDMEEVHKVHRELYNESTDACYRMSQSSIISGFTHHLRQNWLDKKHKQWKVKRSTLREVPVLPETTFNPGSAVQLQTLLYGEDFMGLPVLDLTDSKLPSTGGETLEKLKNHTDNTEYLAFLDDLIEYKTVAIILSTFIPALLKAQLAPDGCYYIFGNFNLGGTLSARLSSSNPNLQNIPASGATKAKARIAKMIKRCIKAIPGWLLVGLDFDSLEDRISALTTKDPQKLKVYQGHIVYSVIVDGVTHHVRDDSTITYSGKTYTGEQFYDAFSC